MSNVISFPKPVSEAPRRSRTSGAQTLFLHVKRTTLIVHLAAPTAKQTPKRVGKKR